MSNSKLPTSSRFCHCSECGRYFGGVNGFERHRVHFQCIDPTSVGLKLNDAGYWVRKPPRMLTIKGGKAVLADISPESSTRESNSTGAPDSVTAP
jgi:hypothetical protein